jgi:hypothetical protein
VGDGLRADDPREHPPGHDQGEGAAVGRGAVGGGEAEGGGDGHVAADEGGEAEQPERAERHREGGEQADEDAAPRAEHEHRPPAEPLRQCPGRQGGRRGPDDEHRHRQGGEGLVRGERVAHHRPGREDDGGVRPRQGLGDGKPGDVAALVREGRRRS